MLAFLQVLNVGFAGRPPARPGRNGHSFHRGQLMPNVNIGKFGGQSPPRLRAISGIPGAAAGYSRMSRAIKQGPPRGVAPEPTAHCRPITILVYGSSGENARGRLRISCNCLGTLLEPGCRHGEMGVVGAGSAAEFGSLSCDRLQNTWPWVHRYTARGRKRAVQTTASALSGLASRQVGNPGPGTIRETPDPRLPIPAASRTLPSAVPNRSAPAPSHCWPAGFRRP